MPFYTPPKEQSFVMEENPNYIVPVIASFNTMGGVQPLYFQYDDKTNKFPRSKLRGICLSFA